MEERRKHNLELDKKLDKHFKEHEKKDESILQALNDHIKKDEDFQRNITDKMEAIHESNKKIETFMENMSGINDISAGISLLKRPALWLLAIVVGVVAFVGGFKTLLGWFLVLK